MKTAAMNQPPVIAAAALADPGAHVGGDAARDRVADPERREDDRERGGENDQRRPGDDGGAARRLHRERGHEQQARPDQGADVERTAANDAELHPLKRNINSSG